MARRMASSRRSSRSGGARGASRRQAPPSRARSRRGRPQEDYDDEDDYQERRPKKRMETWQLVLLIFGGVAVLSLVVVLAVNANKGLGTERPDDVYQKPSQRNARKTYVVAPGSGASGSTSAGRGKGREKLDVLKKLAAELQKIAGSAYSAYTEQIENKTGLSMPVSSERRGLGRYVKDNRLDKYLLNKTEFIYEEITPKLIEAYTLLGELIDKGAEYAGNSTDTQESKQEMLALRQKIEDLVLAAQNGIYAEQHKDE